MKTDVKRVDAWLCKGFDGMCNLVIQRSSQGKIPHDQLLMLDEAITSLDAACVQVGSKEPTLCGDKHMFQLLLQLSKILLARVSEDNGIDGQSIMLVREYIKTLRRAILRFQELELGTAGTKDVE